jgi:HEAT repeat protein
MSIALISLWVAIGAVSVTTLITTGLRAFSALDGARRDRYRRRISEELIAFAVGASDEPPPAPRGRLQQGVMHAELARLAPNLKGGARSELGALFVRYGLIDSARRDLRSRHPLAAIRAAELIGTMGATECVPLLCARLSSSDPLVRLACARALADVGATEAMSQIADALSHDGGQERELGEILMSFGAAAAPFLAGRLRAAQAGEERRVAATTLGEIHAAAAVGDLTAALGDPDQELCARAARALGTIGDGASVPPLIAVLGEDRPAFVHVAAATALGMLGAPDAAPALARALGFEDWDARNAAARALVGLGDGGLRAVLDVLDDIPPTGVAHLAGLLDVADRLDAIIERAAGGHEGMDRFVRAACAAGVRSRLSEAAQGGDAAASAPRRVGNDAPAYAQSVLDAEPVAA